MAVVSISSKKPQRYILTMSTGVSDTPFTYQGRAFTQTGESQVGGDSILVQKFSFYSSSVLGCSVPVIDLISLIGYIQMRLWWS